MKKLQLKQITYSLPEKKNILSNVSFSVSKGEFISILGPSGSGKTTLLKIICGLTRETSGTVLLDSVLISSKNNFIPTHKRNIGLVIQDKALFPHLTIKKNIQFGITSNKNKDIITTELMSTFKITDHSKKYPYELSGGEQQRVALARALAPKPEILLLDEPFNGLDIVLKKEILSELKTILKKTNTTTIMVTHDLEDADNLANNIFYINNGKLTAVK